MVDRDLQKPNDSKLGNCLYFYIPFHPRDISGEKIRDICEKICENEPSELGNFKSMMNDKTGDSMTIDILTVGYHRSKNLRDILCPSLLSESDSCKVSNFI